jgi:1-aminocyclopropane-1-carboxylate deaminase
MNVFNQVIIFQDTSQDVFIKREDLLHPFVSGNKFRKLKYNLVAAKKINATTLLTFGGAFSNHIAAVAYAGKKNGFNTIGIIRGEELQDRISVNPTLKFAHENGMQFKFVSRAAFREKESPAFLLALREEFGNFYLLPEGGTNDLAVKGCEEILTPEDADFDYICCAVGTGGTIAGIINSTLSHQKVLGFPALKGDFLSNDIRKFAQNERFELLNDYHFGGYAKVTPDLILFMNSFYEQTKIPLDPVYTVKMVFGVYDMIQQNYFPKNARILIIHTGGLQGIVGMNQKLAQKNWPKIIFDVKKT